MMITNTKEILLHAFQNGYAVAQFNINNLEWTRFILEECNEKKKPVILGVSEGAINYMGGYNVVVSLVKNLVLDLHISIPVVIHLDHGSSIESCEKAIKAGFTSVMIDASSKTLEKNIEITKKVVEMAHLKNVTVEAEIGHVGGTEDNVISDIYYANIDDALKLVEETGIDSLAPAVGNAHGLYKGLPKLDFDRIQNIATKVNIPLVLHGGTGIDEQSLKQAIALGISKVNINTELQIAWANAIKNYMIQNPDVYDPRKIIKSGEQAIKEIIKKQLNILYSK